MSERELELLSRIEELERHTWRNSAILRSVAMVAFTAIIGIVIASGVVGGGRGSHWSGSAWNTMWLYGAICGECGVDVLDHAQGIRRG